MLRVFTPMRRASQTRRPGDLGLGDAGLTLVELMVSLLLASMLTAGLFYMMSGQSRAYKTELASLSTQENIWGAMEYLQRSVRRAGFGMGGCPAGLIQRYDSSASPPVSPWVIPIRVYNGCNLLTDTNSPPCPSGVADVPDSFEVSFSTHPDGMVASRITGASVRSHSTDAIIVATPGSFYDSSRPTNLLALWQPGTSKPCSLLTVTGSPVAMAGGFSLPHAASTGVNPPDTDNIFPPTGYDIGTLAIDVNSIVTRRFAVDSDPTDPQKVPRLVTWAATDKSDLEVVADGIEDMQVAFACDEGTPPNGAFEEGIDDATRISDEWAHNVGGEVDTDGNGLPDPMLCANGIGSLRLTLTARAANRADTSSTSQRDKAEDRPQGAKDAYLRRRLSIVVQPRNVRGTP